jgi:beta-lactamase superfamily II metal-dependent hydrolase
VARGVDVQYLAAGDRLAGTGEVGVRAVWPQGAASQGKAINDGSLVLAISSAGRCLLLTGDLMPATDVALLAAVPDLRTDAMLWPHHGHEPTAVGELARKLGAKVLVTSSSRPYVSPPKPLWIEPGGMACYHTGEVGAVTLTLWPDGLWVETFIPLPAVGDDSEEPVAAPGEGDDT